MWRFLPLFVIDRRQTFCIALFFVTHKSNSNERVIANNKLYTITKKASGRGLI